MLGNHGHLAYRGHLQQGVGNRFKVNCLGVVLDGGLNGLRVAGVDRRDFKPPAGEKLVKQAEGAAVNLVTHDQVIAGLKDRQGGVDSGHPGGKGEGPLAPFQGRQLIFDRLAGRVPRARVIVGHRRPNFGVFKGCCLVNRRGHGAGTVVINGWPVHQLGIKFSHG